MPSLKKLLSKFTEEERKILETVIASIISLRWEVLDIKKLKGYQNVFRVRKGSLRIIFMKEEKDIFIMAIDRRSETTYTL
ncbi:MAG: type II toxin-antitoxin system RelE/ParE family toxin [Patescibacteria group bacterium]